jgi:hypothetical protein
MLPADERFEGNHLAGLDPKQGLIQDSKWIAVQSGTKISFELQPGNGAIVHGRIEELGASPSHGLSATQGDLGIAEGIVRALGRSSTEGAAVADMDVHGSRLRMRGAETGGLNALRNAEDVAGIGAIFEQDCELVASEARENDVARGVFLRASQRIARERRTR